MTEHHLFAASTGNCERCHEITLVNPELALCKQCVEILLYKARRTEIATAQLPSYWRPCWIDGCRCGLGRDAHQDLFNDEVFMGHAEGPHITEVPTDEDIYFANI